jgi:propionate CoA-transferase
MFVDPRLEGGKINVAPRKSTDKSGCSIAGFLSKLLFYEGPPRDPSGNVTAEREALDLDNLAMAMAVKNSGGVVIVQVERIARSGSLHPRRVLIPGVLVDCVVVAEAEFHRQTYATGYNPA